VAAELLLDLVVILVAAKVAAEVAERIGIPAVLGEIAAGIALGPSALGLIEANEVLRVVGEIGVILLLLEVGMEMDLRELARVGKASMIVAVGGMVLPFVTGWAALSALGHGGSTAIFLGAALTATSVGITARAFGDLRALASTEARVVIGAAVADDVLGLIVLTVVARLVGGDGIEGIEVLSVIGVAFGFLIVATAVGVNLVPRAVALVHRVSSSSGTLVAVAFAFTLALAELAHAAELAPIVGAFVAGLSLGRSRQHERIARELAPLGHVFVPVFFLLIGTEAELSALTDPTVLGLAAAMSLVGVLGKVAAGWGAVGTPADRLLIGLGMVPRGEVGLIFATIGKEAGVLDDQLYAALLVVVLVTTVITPPLLRWRHGQLARRAAGERSALTIRPDDGWLDAGAGSVELRGEPEPAAAVEIALEAAGLAEGHDPGPRLLAWFDRLDHGEVGRWSADDTARLSDLLATASGRSWRLLEASGVLATALPEVAATMERRRSDVGILDLDGIHRWPILDAVRQELERRAGSSRGGGDGRPTVRDPGLLLLAALVADVAESVGDEAATELVERFALVPDDARTVLDATRDAHTMRAAALHVDGLDPDSVLVLADHLGSVEQARRVHVLATATAELDDWQQERLDALLDLLVDALDTGDGEASAASMVERRRFQALELARSPLQSYRVRKAPASLLLAAPAEEVARRVALLDAGVPPPGSARVEVAEGPDADGGWEVVVIGSDAAGFLARVAAAFTGLGLEIVAATAASWPDGAVLDVFTLSSPGERPDPLRLAQAIQRTMRGPIEAEPMRDLELRFDDASPRHTWCTVTGPDRTGVLHAVAAVLAQLDISIHSARIETTAEGVHDRLALTDRRGDHLDAATRAAIGELLASGVTPRSRRRRRSPVAP